MYGSIPNRLSKNKRALSKYSVGSDDPGLAFDFVDNIYRKGEGQTANLSSAITHARAGNATMTDGYGPELVTNGGFDSDSDWTLGTGWSIQNNRAYHAYGSNSNITQNIAVEAGKAYILEFDILEGSANFLWFSVDGAFTAIDSPQVRGGRSFVFTHNTTETIAVGVRAGSSNVATIDNVSVREMPVIKWAPHNLLTYSEDFTQWNAVNTVVESNISGVSSPDGTETANLLRDNTSGTTTRYLYLVSSGINGTWTGSVFIKLKDANRYLQLRPSGLGTGVAYATFDPADGSLYQSGGSALVSTNSLNVGGGWYQVSMTCSSALASSGDGFNLTLTDGTSGELPSYTGDGTSGIYAWGAHLYRSDLGGMADNPDQPLSRASYVPTTSAAKHLPRVGHHVYNGSAWVNEGVLAESESRTNLIDYSDFSSGWIDGGAGSLNLTENSAVSPDGTQNALEAESTGSGSSSYIKPSSAVFTNGLSVTVSVYAKAGTHSLVRISNNTSSSNGAWFDLSDGTIGADNDVGGHGNTANIEDVGNGWYRLSRYFGSVTTGSNDIIIGPSDVNGSSGVAPANTTMYFYGVQAEVGSTPSSLIPTSGSSVTRAAETFTIPSANLPWPTPQYIGSELVTNGTFDTDISDWVVASNSSTIAHDTGGDGGRIAVTTTGSAGNGRAAQSMGELTTGKLYRVSVDFDRGTANSTYVRITRDSAGGANVKQVEGSGTSGTIEFNFIPASTADFYVVLVGGNTAGQVAYFDNISVREINPLSVSIGMEGRMTYADTDNANEINFVRWLLNASNQILIKLRTNGSKEGEVFFRQEENNVTSDVATAGDLYQAGVLLPFDLAQRSGSTFVNGAVNGVALTANTTPTALPDLSSRDLELAQTYMGTISEFRVWDKDLGDDSIVDATNPSLEPSLSLTFEGVGTNSFVVNNWSE